MRRIQGEALGECHCCGAKDVPVHTMHTLGHLVVCNTCLLDCGRGQAEAQGVPEYEEEELPEPVPAGAGLPIPCGWGSLGEVWDRR